MRIPRRLILGATVIATTLAVGLTVAGWRAEPWMRERIVQGLARHLDSEVTLASIEVRLFPTISVTGRELVIRHRGRRDIPPLIVVGEVRGATSWTRLFSRHVQLVALEGLEITIPPRRGDDMPDLGSDDGSGSGKPAVTVARLESNNARLSILPKNPQKDPRVFDIFTLAIDNLTFERPSNFEATLTNPIPFGTIQTAGSFGPWIAEEPSQTAVNGTYTFDADLGTIKGIAGALTSEGKYTGIVDRIVATGTTKTPDFRIPKLEAEALPLSTTYAAVIDGTNGDVVLERVDSVLGHSRIHSKGAIVGTKGIKGKRVTLEVTSQDALMEDFLRLTVKARPVLMTGRMSLQTSFDLPQGDRDVIDKLRLAGKVHVADAHFTRDAVQDKVDAFSRRAQGRPNDRTVEEVASDVSTAFTLNGGVLTLKDLAYAVTGASVRLGGTYRLDSRALDLSGVVRLKASVSDTQTGFKHFLLKPFDALFRKNGAGAELAITVKGSADDPKVGLDIKKTLKGN